MNHEQQPGFTGKKTERELFAEVIAAAEAQFDRFGPVEMQELPNDFTCVKQRADNTTDRYVFNGQGMEFTLLHDRSDNSIVEPFLKPNEANLDPQARTMQQIEDDLLRQCRNALKSHLESERI